MVKFLEKYNFQRLNQEEIDNLNRPITTCEMETPILKTSRKQKTWLNGFTEELYQTYNEELIPNLLKLFWKIFKMGEHSQMHSMRPPLP